MSSADIPDIQDIVQMYLAQRNYSNDDGDEVVAGDDSATEPAESRSLSELAVDVTASGAVTSTGSVHLAAVSLDPNTADTQYSRFRVWVLDAPEPYRTELTELLFHVFVRLHLELVAGGHSPARFYSRHHVAFMLDALQCRTVTELAAVNSIDDLQRSHFKSYMTQRSHAALSADCVRYLRGALVSAAASVPLVVQVVALSISLQPADQRAPESEQLDSNQLPQPDSTSGLHGQCVNESAEASPSSLSRDCGLQQAISALRRESPPAPTVCAYRVTGAVLSSAAVSRDLAALATAGDAGVRLWSLAPAGLQWCDNAAARVPLGCDLLDTDDGEQLSAADDDGQQLREGRCASRQLLGHCGSVFDVRFCQTDDALLLTAGEDGTVRGWRRDGCDNICIYRGHNYPVWSVSCQRDEGQLFVTGSMDRTARLWTYERTHQLRVFVGHSQDVDCVAIHPNGNYVCTASGDGTLRLWSTAAAAEVRCISAHSGVVHDLQFSPDGKSIAVAGEDCTVRVYDLSSGALLHQLKSHRCSVSSLLWTPTGGCLVSADRDGTLLTWDTAANSSCVTYSPSSTFVSPGYSVAGLHYARHNYLVAVYGQQG